MRDLRKCGWSNHCRIDRADRMVLILTTIGLGEIIAEKEDFQNHNTIRCFTDTGLIVVINPETNTIITVFISTINQMTEYFEGNVPLYIRKAVVSNSKKFHGGKGGGK